MHCLEEKRAEQHYERKVVPRSPQETQTGRWINDKSVAFEQVNLSDERKNQKYDR